MTIIVGVVAGLVVSWSAWWWIIRRDKRHGKHRTTLPPADLAKAMHEVRASGMRGADSMAVLKSAAAGADTNTAPPTRHTHRDPTTGRYTRKAED